MKKTSEPLIFFGSGPVAAASLKRLAQYFYIESVITKPATVQDMALLVPEDRVYAVSTRQELDDVISTNQFQSRLGVLIDFGIIVSRSVIDSFALGIVNSHFSLLPKLRGADPISFAILNGESKTGVSLMLIDEHMDTGKLIGQKSLNITDTDTTPTLTEKLISLSNDMLSEYLPQYIRGEITPRTQPHTSRATYSRKLSKEDGVIDWNKPAQQIEREVRAYIDWPKSRTELAGKEVIVTEAEVTDGASQSGEIVVRDKEIVVFTGDKALKILKLKPAGKPEMSAEAFLAGNKL